MQLLQLQVTMFFFFFYKSLYLHAYITSHLFIKELITKLSHILHVPTVSIWKADRKVVNPGLNTISNFPKFLESFNENGKRLADRLFSNNDTRKGRDIYVDLFQTTTEIVFGMFFFFNF